MPTAVVSTSRMRQFEDGVLKFGRAYARRIQRRPATTDRTMALGRDGLRGDPWEGGTTFSGTCRGQRRRSLGSLLLGGWRRRFVGDRDSASSSGWLLAQGHHVRLPAARTSRRLWTVASFKKNNAGHNRTMPNTHLGRIFAGFLVDADLELACAVELPAVVQSPLGCSRRTGTEAARYMWSRCRWSWTRSLASATAASVSNATFFIAELPFPPGLECQANVRVLARGRPIQP